MNIEKMNIFPKEELPIINEKGKEYRKYSLDLFDNSSEYYNDLYLYF